MPNQSVPDKNENNYLEIVQGLLHTLIRVTVVCLLQLWIQDGDSNDTQASDSALRILLNLECSMVTNHSKCQPDHSALGPQTKRTLNAINHGSLHAFAMVDRKSKAFDEYEYHHRQNGSFTSKSKNGLIQEIISDGRPFCMIRKALLDCKSKGKRKAKVDGVSKHSIFWPKLFSHLRFLKSANERSH